MGKRDAKGQGVLEKEVLPHLDALYRYALYLTRSSDGAEDLAQETLLKAVGSIGLYHEGTNCKAWLFKIMTNTFLNKERRKIHTVEMDDNTAWESGGADLSQPFIQANRSPEESFVAMLSRAKVREAVEMLPDEFRSVVILADLEEFTYKEIAEILSCPIGTVMSRLHRGRRALRQMLMEWACDLGLVDSPESAVAEGEKRSTSSPNLTHIALYRRKKGVGDEL